MGWLHWCSGYFSRINQLNFIVYNVGYRSAYLSSPDIFRPVFCHIVFFQILAAIDYPNLQRLECPDACPAEIYDLMLQCWNQKPEKRPSFADIVQQLPEIIPQSLVTITSCRDGIIDHLQYSKNETIIVLSKW